MPARRIRPLHRRKALRPENDQDGGDDDGDGEQTTFAHIGSEGHPIQRKFPATPDRAVRGRRRVNRRATMNAVVADRALSHDTRTEQCVSKGRRRMRLGRRWHQAVTLNVAAANRGQLLTPGPFDPQLRDFRLQRRALHSKLRGGTGGTADLPVRRLQGPANVFALGLFERRRR